MWYLIVSIPDLCNLTYFNLCLQQIYISFCLLLFPFLIISYHNRIFDLRAGAGASSTSVGPFPGNWLAARIADLTPDLQVLLSGVRSAMRAFKNTSIKKVNLGENFTVKCKMWDKIQNLKATKLIFVVCHFFKTNFLVLQAKLRKNVLTACLLTTPITGSQDFMVSTTLILINHLPIKDSFSNIFLL